MTDTKQAVQDAATRDELARLLELANAGRLSSTELSAELVRLAQERTSNTSTEAPLVTLASVLPEAFACMDARAEGREQPLSTPWPDFNDQLAGGGFWPGCHVLVSGTGMGKSAWSLQLALHAATMNKAAVVYVGLELDNSQIALRLAGEIARVGWSKLYTGQADTNDRSRARDAAHILAGLPFYLEAGDPMGWSATQLQQVAERVRKRHSNLPLLIVVDFLQLMGSDSDGQRQDLRERIGRAAYAARHVAKRLNATVLLISSVSREAYAKVSGIDALKAAGISADVQGSIVVERFLRSPDTLVGLGKESGEIEYAADTVTTAITLPKEEGKRVVVFATAKVRSGPPGWSSLIFDGYRFAPDPLHGHSVITRLTTTDKNDPQSGASGTARARGSLRRNSLSEDDK